MQQILRITGPLTSTSPRTITLSQGNRNPVTVDAIAVFLRSVPDGAGAQPATEAELQMLERQIRLRIARDQNLTELITPTMVPIRSFIAKEVGPVPIVPFPIGKLDQTTIEWETDANVFLTAPFVLGGGSSINLEVLLFGQDDRG